MREKGQTEVAKTLETPVFSRGIEILTEKIKLPFQDIQDTGRKEELYLPLMEHTYIQFIRITKNMLLAK